MKKLLAALLALVLLSLPALAEGVKVVTTVFPVYDWVRVITDGTNAEVSWLTSGGVDMHSYRPSVNDMVDIAVSDLFIYAGGESDAWTRDAQCKIGLSLISALGDAAANEEVKEGMQAEDEEEDEAYDEHVWLSVKNAAILCRAIAEELCALDPENAEIYMANLEGYLEELAALDREYTQALSAAEYKTLLFADRFPFLYLTRDYGLDYFAAFPGCSAESEASFDTIIFLAGKLDEMGLPAVMIIEGSDGRIAETVRSCCKNKNLRITALDSLQSVTLADAASGKTYISAMRENLEKIASALNP